MRFKGGSNTTARVRLYFRLFCKILLGRIYLSKIALSFFRGERKFPATPCRNFFLAMRLEGCKDFFELVYDFPRYSQGSIVQLFFCICICICKILSPLHSASAVVGKLLLKWSGCNDNILVVSIIYYVKNAT